MSDRPLSRRERQARSTRDEILAAARRLFAERGYGRTTIRDVAEAAGVSAQTVYDSVGSKQALVARLNDLIDAEAGVGPIAMAGFGTDDPRRLVATNARITRAILERCGDIVHALMTGADTEPELAAILVEGNRRHRDGAARIAARLDELGALDSGIAVADAAETLAVVSDMRVALLLQDDYGWSLDRIESWIATTATALVLAPPARGRRPRSS